MLSVASILETPLAAAIDSVNRQIRDTTPATELCEQLAGRVFAVRVQNSSLALYLSVEGEGLSLSTDLDDNAEPDVTIEGSVISLSRMLTADSSSPQAVSGIEISGDVAIAEQFRDLLRFAKPDLEEELARRIGDAPAHRLGNFARSALDWGRRSRATMTQNIAEYLQEESRSVPSRRETDRFRQSVDTLRDDAARLEARIARLERQRNS